MYNGVYTIMAETRIPDQDFYTGIVPTVFKKIERSDVKVNPFKAHKFWSVISGSDTGSILPLTAIYSDVNILPALGSELTFNDSSNIDGSLQTITYFSINHQYFKYKDQPANTFGPTNLTQTKKYLFQSASILSFPQIRVGEGIKPETFILTASYLTTTIAASYYGTASYLSSYYGAGGAATTESLYIKSDKYGNLYDIEFNTASIVSGVKFYEGFNEYFDINRISYTSTNVIYALGVTAIDGYLQPIGYAAQFLGNGYIKTKLDGLYNRDNSYAMSFFISASNTGTNKIIIAKASSSLTPQYPFKIELSGSNQIIFSAAGGTELKTQITSSTAITSWTHVVCQKTGSMLQMFINGTLESSISNDLLINTNSPFTASARIDNTLPLFIGGFENESNLNGVIDEIRIFNKGLLDPEIHYLGDRLERGTMLQTNHVGNIFTKQGVAVVSSANYLYNDILQLPYSASYRSTKTIYEMGVTVEVGSGDFNTSLNHSLTTDDDETYQPFVTASAFAPYITTIGLYDDSGQLLAIGKLAQPIRKRSDVDMNFLVRLDLDRNIS